MKNGWMDEWMNEQMNEVMRDSTSLKTSRLSEISPPTRSTELLQFLASKIVLN